MSMFTRLFGQSQSKSKPVARNARLGFESLEAREVPTFIIQVGTSDYNFAQDSAATVSVNRLTPNFQKVECDHSTTADVTGDGTPDLIVGVGPGGGFYDRVIEGSSTRAADDDQSQVQFIIQMGTSEL